jgi:MoaA/NifB/PqqE/SkfB family radical SAM enzyme
MKANGCTKLTGVHFILTYMCNFECDHCFLSCGPNSRGTFTLAQIKDALRQIKRIATVKSVCFEGGEPFLFFPVLLEGVRLAHDAGLKTAIETNTYWATSEDDAELWLRPLLKSHLSAMEVSDDAFHHDEEIANSAKRALAAAERIGMNVSSICIEKPAAEGGSEQAKGEPIYLGGAKLRGRAVETLVDGLPTRSWEGLTECPLEDLRNPERVHIDPFGTVHLCQGLSMGNIWQTPLADLVRDYNPDTHPICGPLLRGGPAQLAREYDVQHEDRYVDPCHMCSRMCIALIDRFPQYLTPRQVYGLEQET